MKRPPPPRLLAISSGELAAADDPAAEIARWLEPLAMAPIAAAQIREKELSDRRLCDLCATARACSTGTLLVNGRGDLALLNDLEGVHLPSDGVPADLVRQMVGDGRLVGVSTHRLDEVRDAARRGADYVTFGPVFDTPSKRRYGDALGLDLLQRAAEIGPPVLAIGGIDRDHITAVIARGAWGVAAIRACSHRERVKEMLLALG